VLHRILDNAQARLYDGSLVEWVDWGGEVHDSTDDMGGPIG
jgi:3-mercaptopyruvate sulfurtransferase SseA